MFNTILKMFLALGKKAQTWVIILIIILVAVFFIVRELLAHQERLIEINNKYSTEKRSLEIALENCQ